VFLPPEEPILQYVECIWPDVRTPRWAMPRKAALMMYDRIETLSCGCNYDTLTGACTAQCRYHRISEAVRLLNEVLREMDEEAGELDLPQGHSSREESDAQDGQESETELCAECGHPHRWRPELDEYTPCPICEGWDPEDGPSFWVGYRPGTDSRKGDG